MDSQENLSDQPSQERQSPIDNLIELPVDVSSAEIDPEALKQTLIASRQKIIEDIHRQFEKTLENFPGYEDSKLPGKLVAVLSSNVGKQYAKVIEPESYWNNSTGGIFTDMRDIKPKFHPFWLAVAEAGFIPEVRIKGSFTNPYGQAELNARITPSIDS